MTEAKYGATREMLSQMVKDGQAKNLGRGRYVLPDTALNIPDNADNLTNQGRNVSSSGLSGHFRKEEMGDSVSGSADLFINDGKKAAS